MGTGENHYVLNPLNKVGEKPVERCAWLKFPLWIGSLSLSNISQRPNKMPS